MSENELKLLIKQAEDGDDEALQQLRKEMDSDWDAWQPLGDLSQHVKLQFMTLLSSKNVLARESMVKNLERMTTELQGESESPIRKHAVDQVLIGWLDVSYQQLLAAEPRTRRTETEFLERRLQRAQKRYAVSLETLARVKSIEKGETL